MCACLHKSYSLPDVSVIDILTGLAICSVPDCIDLFDFLLQMVQADALQLDYDLS